MSELEPLPEFYVTDDRQRVSMATYEALVQCQIIMTSAETGVTGPTLVEPGEIFSTEAPPCKDWRPLNRAAEERMTFWEAQLPASGQGISQADITEAAYIMRPREGEAELPHEQWYPAVLKLAATLRDKRQGNSLRVPAVAPAHRPGINKAPIMPYASSGASVAPDMVGRLPDSAPRQQPQPGSAQRRRPQSPMPNAPTTTSPSQTAG